MRIKITFKPYPPMTLQSVEHNDVIASWINGTFYCIKFYNNSKLNVWRFPIDVILSIEEFDVLAEVI